MSVVERLSTNYLTVRKSLLELYENASSTDSIGDIGFYSAYYDSASNLNKYTGLFRDQSDNNKYKLFTGLSEKPTTNDSVNTNATGFILADLNVGALDAKNTLNVQNSDAATSASSGSATFAGGIGVAKDSFFGGLVDINTTLTVGGNSTLNGSLQVNGSTATFACQQMAIYDNIVVDNVSDVDANYAGDDAGYVSGRVPLNIGDDTPKVSNKVLITAFGSTDTKIEIDTNGTDSFNNYYVGWAIKKNTNEVRIVTADVYDGAKHTLTIASAFGSEGKVGTTTFNMYNQTNVGWVWDESENQLSAFAFPRDTVSILDPTATDGSAPEYAKIKVGDIEVVGALSANINPVKSQTISSSTTLTEANLKTYSMWFISPSLGSNITVTLPDTDIMNTTNVSYRVTIANLSTQKITIARQNADVIEGETSFIMQNQYDKMTFFSYDGGWLIE